MNGNRIEKSFRVCTDCSVPSVLAERILANTSHIQIITYTRIYYVVCMGIDRSYDPGCHRWPVTASQPTISRPLIGWRFAAAVIFFAASQFEQGLLPLPRISSFFPPSLFCQLSRLSILNIHSRPLLFTNTSILLSFYDPVSFPPFTFHNA
jgi:hypothetical protein